MHDNPHFLHFDELSMQHWTCKCSDISRHYRNMVITFKRTFMTCITQGHAWNKIYLREQYLGLSNNACLNELKKPLNPNKSNQSVVQICWLCNGLWKKPIHIYIYINKYIWQYAFHRIRNNSIGTWEAYTHTHTHIYLYSSYHFMVVFHTYTSVLHVLKI